MHLTFYTHIPKAAKSILASTLRGLTSMKRDDIIFYLQLWPWQYFRLCVMQNKLSPPFLTLWIIVINIIVPYLIASSFLVDTDAHFQAFCSSDLSVSGSRHLAFWQYCWSCCSRRSTVLLNCTQEIHNQAKPASTIHRYMCSYYKPDKADRISSWVWGYLPKESRISNHDDDKK